MIRVKTNAKVKGIPSGRIAVSPAELEGERRVCVHVSAIDTFGMPRVVTTLTLSPDEALRIAADLQRSAQ